MTAKIKKINDVFSILEKTLKKKDEGTVITFNEFLWRGSDYPERIFRNIFQLFNNMIYYYITEENVNENDPENINYKTIHCDKLLIDNTDTPFFADLPLANRLVRLADSFKEGAQQNKIYVFIGPPGSGKSTFLNNLLWKFQEYTQLNEGTIYEILWKIDEAKLGPSFTEEIKAALEDYYKKNKKSPVDPSSTILNIPCPSHDHPILMIPRDQRREVLAKLLNDDVRTKIFFKKEYEWIFKDEPCTICQSIYQALSNRLKSPADIFSMLYARRYYFNRRLGNGITVFNPGDKEPEKNIYSNEVIQSELGFKFKDSNLVKYVFSRYAKTNNGVFAIMDVKGYNEKRFLDLHGVISEGVHKIEEIEENVNSLFIAVMNPEDKEKIRSLDSFRDRIKEINVNYNLNYKEEVNIYHHAFGKQIQKSFLPRVLNNFAKIIISSRLNPDSYTLKEWIKDPTKYNKYCDEDLLLLKLSIYNNIIPNWLTEEDHKKFDKTIRRKLISESELEGRTGFSGRESINIFNEFYTSIKKKYTDNNGSKKRPLITMNDIREFFSKHKMYSERIPTGFIESIIRLYDYDVIQQIKESLFHQNEERIRKDIQNYLFASNYDNGEKVLCPYTNEVVDVSDTFFSIVEQHLLQTDVTYYERREYRKAIANRFVTTLQEMQINDGNIEVTEVYRDLYNHYMKNLRENIFQPFLQYTAFENALKEYDTPKFEVYDNRIKDEVKFLITNLVSKFNYTLEGAIQVCLYILHKNMPVM